jgi:hypothetical protein
LFPIQVTTSTTKNDNLRPIKAILGGLLMAAVLWGGIVALVLLLE